MAPDRIAENRVRQVTRIHSVLPRADARKNLMRTSINTDCLVAVSISPDGASNSLRPYGCGGVRQLLLRMSDYSRTKRFPCHVAVKV